ncbi:hypothetical protein FEM03_10080 [Phragmitibacter flavus]|uniref:Uncharacterized protein n=1 Tax=Phragmitibacter flavus TaxID=2576071 RepID=A0A5R8KEB7_9BACT|nr:hypothetical protein [Phragmitibacter flavus]TLD70656.1 hypothetical protein FEM03_10080 [Phragmitibacter flavus]
MIRIPSSETWKRWWLKLPFRHMTALVIFLYVVGEQFPFSNFPMYSNFGLDADVMYVTDENDQPLSMKPLLRTSSSSAKKRYKKELSELCKKSNRNINDALPAERQKAGAIVLQSLIYALNDRRLNPDTRELRLYLRTFEFDREQDHVREHVPELLATQILVIPSTSPADS